MASSAQSPVPSISTDVLPLDTKGLRLGLKRFLDEDLAGIGKIGSCKFGVYAFFDYDEEPIYVGQTCESLRSRIGRHLTNQRTDAVAMSVLDPYEVYSIEVWPLPEYQEVSQKQSSLDWKKAKGHLDSLEATVFDLLMKRSKFNAVLNEKVPHTAMPKKIPVSHKGVIVSREVADLRGHPDVRIARRAQTIARLALVVCERDVQPGLRRTLRTQARRLQWLVEQRFAPFEGAAKAEDAKADGDNVVLSEQPI